VIEKSPGGERMASTVKETLDAILNCFESGKIPEAVAYSVFPGRDIPSAKWSLLNRIAMFLSGTADARGFRQWKKVNRHVKKGAKAIHILVPRMVKRSALNKQGEQEEQVVLAGFMGRPVFRIEDTDGQPLEYEQIELPELPLMDRAREWGISVKAIPGNYQYYGYFSQDRQEIGLATKEESVFFHELAHCAHRRLETDYRTIPPWEKEVVAELAAAALCKIVGRSSPYLGSNLKYISHYAETAGLSPLKACLRVITQTEAVLGLILAQAPGAPVTDPEQAGPLFEPTGLEA